jgi:dTDP-4-dehydrorhamnose reductase
MEIDFDIELHRVAVKSSRRILITGANGTLGRAFSYVCEKRGLPYLALTRQSCDISDFECVERVIDELKPWAVINAAGFCDVDGAELQPELCRKENTTGASNLATVCQRQGIKLVTFSSDLVFDGQRSEPYTEEKTPNPLSIYGHSKLEAEKSVLNIDPNAMIVRTSAFFGPWDEHNFLIRTLRSLAGGHRVEAASDLIVSPTYVPDLVHQTLDLMIDDERGVIHLSNLGFYSWYEFGSKAVVAAKSRNKVVPVAMQDVGYRAKRPVFSALASTRSYAMPDIDSAIERFTRECRVAW